MNRKAGYGPVTRTRRPGTKETTCDARRARRGKRSSVTRAYTCFRRFPLVPSVSIALNLNYSCTNTYAVHKRIDGFLADATQERRSSVKKQKNNPPPPVIPCNYLENISHEQRSARAHSETIRLALNPLEKLILFAHQPDSFYARCGGIVIVYFLRVEGDR